MASKPPVEVVINGQRYVKATDAVPAVDDIMQALYEGYMGSGTHWKADPHIGNLFIGGVNEDGDGASFEEFAATIAEIAARGGGQA